MIAKYYPNRIKELEKEITNIEKDINLIAENTNIANELEEIGEYKGMKLELQINIL